MPIIEASIAPYMEKVVTIQMTEAYARLVRMGLQDLLGMSPTRAHIFKETNELKETLDKLLGGEI